MRRFYLLAILLSGYAATSNAKTSSEVLEFYINAENAKPTIRQSVESAVGKKFSQWNQSDYAAFLKTLNPKSVDDFMKWSALTGIVTVGLHGTSMNYYYNTLLAPFDLAKTWDYYDLRDLQTKLVSARKAILTNQKTSQSWTREFTEDVFQPFPYKSWSDYKVRYSSLQEQLIDIKDIPHFDVIFAADMKMPLSMVLMLKDVGNYLMSGVGRSFTIAMPVSNTVYPLSAGLLPGSFIEQRGHSAEDLELLSMTAVHELCHSIDYVAIHTVGYPMDAYPWVYSAATAMKGQRLSLFQGNPSALGKLPLPPGYISDYSLANDQEDFAEHCTYFVMQRDRFAQMAKEQSSKGNSLLKSKFDFMSELFK